MVNLLKTVVIYNEDDSYQKYNGQAVIFNITKNDGLNISVSSYEQFMIIDNVGYRTKETASQNLHNFGNKIQYSKE